MLIESTSTHSIGWKPLEGFWIMLQLLNMVRANLSEPQQANRCGDFTQSSLSSVLILF
jgi:hypothetical protein